MLLTGTHSHSDEQNKKASRVNVKLNKNRVAGRAIKRSRDVGNEKGWFNTNLEEFNMNKL